MSTAERQGYPVGSGLAKRVITLRMNKRGMRWKCGFG